MAAAAHPLQTTKAPENLDWHFADLANAGDFPRLSVWRGIGQQSLVICH